jgi:hypothetical protein
MYDYEKYKIKVGQTYKPASGSISSLTVLDVTTHADCGDVIVRCNARNIEYRIDCFKLTMVKYNLVDVAPVIMPAFRDEYRDGLEQYIPAHMHQGMDYYVKHHITPGGFLFAMLANQLELAAGKADETNRNLMHNYLSFFRECLDPEIWGTPEKVQSWINKR